MILEEAVCKIEMKSLVDGAQRVAVLVISEVSTAFVYLISTGRPKRAKMRRHLNGWESRWSDGNEFYEQDVFHRVYLVSNEDGRFLIL